MSSPTTTRILNMVDLMVLPSTLAPLLSAGNDGKKAHMGNGLGLHRNDGPVRTENVQHARHRRTLGHYLCVFPACLVLEASANTTAASILSL